MSLRSVKLRFAHQHVRAVVLDRDGERGRDLHGEAALRVFAAARGLLVALEPHWGGGAGGESRTSTVRAISIDLAKRVARLTLESDGMRGASRAAERSCGVRIAGNAFDDLDPALELVTDAVLAEVAALAAPR